jgi:hypothetical protein
LDWPRSSCIVAAEVECLSGINLLMRARLCVAALAVAALAWCPGAMGQDLGVPAARSCQRAVEAKYFPAGTFSIEPDSYGDVFIRYMYSKALALMEEPSLSCGVQKEVEAYRFLRYPAFGAPVAARVFRYGNLYRLEAVVLSGTTETRRLLPHVSRRVTRDVSREQWLSVLAKLDDVRFWQLPTISPGLWTGRDGEQWIVDAHRDGRYHIVDRWMGADGIESVGRLLLGLAGLKD